MVKNTFESFWSTYQNDRANFEKQKSRYLHYYTDNNDKEVLSEARKGLHIRDFPNSRRVCHPRFSRNNACHCPWIDREIWETYEQADGTFPTRIASDRVCFAEQGRIQELSADDRRQFQREAKDNTERCIERFKRGTPILEDSFGAILFKSGQRAAEQLSFHNQGDGRRDKSALLEDCVYDTAKNTNSGFPFFRRKNSKMCISDTLKWIDDIFNRPSSYRFFKNPIIINPSTIFYRVQPSMNYDDDTVGLKIREVWGLPQRIVALENYFFRDILESVYKNNYYSDKCIYSSGLTNFDISRKIVSRLRNRLSVNYGSKKKLFSIDYSKYDQTVPDYAIDMFYHISSDYIDMDANELKVYDYLRQYIKYTPFVFDGEIDFQERGVPSGSYITNLIDTWWNCTLWILSSFYYYEYYSTLPDGALQSVGPLEKGVTTILVDKRIEFEYDIGLCGDDCIYYGFEYVVKIHEEICSSIGMIANLEFVCEHSSNDIYFLGRFWDADNKPFQPFIYFFTHLAVRTKFYSASEVDFDISEELNLNRALSICLQHSNGKEFLLTYFYNYKPVMNYLNSFDDFTLLKDYPVTDGYKKINRVEAMSWTNF